MKALKSITDVSKSGTTSVPFPEFAHFRLPNSQLRLTAHMRRVPEPVAAALYLLDFSPLGQ